MNFSNTCFVLSAVEAVHYSSFCLPEVVLVGRSNVGKSSLINCLCCKKKLAKVGLTPGKTALINFYNVDNKIHIVDLPGYGYAKISKAEKKFRAAVVDSYLASSSNIVKIIQLVDIRHQPTADDDVMLEWVRTRGFCTILLATKLDKLKRSQKDLRLRELNRYLDGYGNFMLLPFSSKTKEGIHEVRKLLASFVTQDVNICKNQFV